MVMLMDTILIIWYDGEVPHGQLLMKYPCLSHEGSYFQISLQHFLYKSSNFKFWISFNFFISFFYRSFFFHISFIFKKIIYFHSNIFYLIFTSFYLNLKLFSSLNIPLIFYLYIHKLVYSLFYPSFHFVLCYV